MRLSLNNIGKIESASVEIKGITVIAGENNTGKSTVGRALYAVFNSFCNIQEQIRAERIESVKKLVDRFLVDASYLSRRIVDTHGVAESIVSHMDGHKSSRAGVQDEIISLLCQYDSDILDIVNIDMRDEVVSDIMDVFQVSDQEFLKSVLNKKLNVEFDDQICNIFSDGSQGEIRLEIKQQTLAVSIKEDKVFDVSNPEGMSLHTEVIYLDDPFILDEPQILIPENKIIYSSHRTHLRSKIFSVKTEGNLVDEIIAKDKMERIYEKLSVVCGGDIIRDKRVRIGYRRKNSDKVLNVRNLSTGLKTFVILKMLLVNGVIEKNGTIILDEPEIHLHPEWQLLFAELIVLVQKEFGIHILLNTHSPYFLNAIEVYAAKYGIADRCRYYLASSREDISRIEDVTDNIEAIYSTLARPLQDLENERGRL